MAVEKGYGSSTGRSTGRPKPKKKGMGGGSAGVPKGPGRKDTNATVRALRSKSTNPAAAARSRAVAKKPYSDGALQAAVERRSTAKAKVRSATRRAVRKGMPAGELKGGLGITKDEGSKGLQRSIKTLGYKKAKKLVKKVAAKRG